MKLWGGRFAGDTDPLVRRYTCSLPVDRRMFRQDVRGSIAHARMLGECGIIDREESALLIGGLEAMLREMEAGAVSFDSDDEDIHSLVERLLIQRIGPLGGKLHTARSRNDQVATDLRLYAREAIDDLRQSIKNVQSVLIDLAEGNRDTLVPGYTHLQRAQPVTLAHHLLAYFWMLQRDLDRLADCRGRVNVSPLGSGALAGAAFPIDREMVARELGFVAVSENSMDAVSDRDFAVELVFDLSLLMTHLSRLCEELVLWSTREFGFLEFDDRFATGSSMMPQKKNPDVAELARGRTGRVVGDLVALLTLLKALPLTYNRDLQEDKTSVFDAIDVTGDTLEIMAPALQSLTWHREAMTRAAEDGMLLATDLADGLSRRGVPFREAHEIVGRVVRWCLSRELRLNELSLDDLRAIDPRFEAEAVQALSRHTGAQRRQAKGSAGPNAVAEQISAARQLLGASDPSEGK